MLYWNLTPHTTTFFSVCLIFLSEQIKSQWCVFTNAASLRWLSDRRTLSQIQICSFVMLLPVFRNHCSFFKAYLMLVLWKPPLQCFTFGCLIRYSHAVAHTSGTLYLHLNHLITPSSTSPHNWMKRRNRSVTPDCFHDLYFLLNICV